MLALFSDGRRESTGEVLHRLHLCRSPQMLTPCLRIASNEFGQKYVRLQHCWDYRSVSCSSESPCDTIQACGCTVEQRQGTSVVWWHRSCRQWPLFFLTCYNFGFQTWSLYYELPVSWACVIKLTMQGTTWRRKPGKRIKHFAHTVIHYCVHCFVFDTKPWWWW